MLPEPRKPGTQGANRSSRILISMVLDNRKVWPSKANSPLAWCPSQESPRVTARGATCSSSASRWKCPESCRVSGNTVVPSARGGVAWSVGCQRKSLARACSEAEVAQFGAFGLRSRSRSRSRARFRSSNWSCARNSSFCQATEPESLL